MRFRLAQELVAAHVIRSILYDVLQKENGGRTLFAEEAAHRGRVILKQRSETLKVMLFEERHFCINQVKLRLSSYGKTELYV